VAAAVHERMRMHTTFFRLEKRRTYGFFFFEKENVWLLVGREWYRPFWALAHSVFVLALFFVKTIV
jgi:hypothetical protein